MSGQIFLESGELSVSETGGTILVAIVRTGDLSQAATVTFGVTADGATEGADYIDATGSITFEPGQSRVLVPISILDDDVGEPTESITLSLISTDSGSLLAPRTANIAILDNEIPATDPPEPGLISNYEIQETTVIDDLSLPIAVRFSPTNDDIAYVAEKQGVIKTVNLATGETTTFLDISDQVNNTADRGLMNFILHPEFETNGIFYVFYVADPADGEGSAGPDLPNNRFAYVSKFEADPATGFTTAIESSEDILIGGAATSAQDIIGGQGQVRSDVLDGIDIPPSDYDPNTGEAIQDYIKLDSTSHAGGGMAFGPDGNLYIAVGDGIAFNFVDPRGVSVQDINSLSGKVLRVDPMTGLGLSDNPFATDDLSENASKVYQLGLRNPFRLTFDQNGQILISDTGWNSYEEINTGPPGANYGWPFYEGGDNGVIVETGGYNNLPEAGAFYDAVAAGDIIITSAFRAFSHKSSDPGFQVQAITGSSSIYDGGRYEGVFDNHYFFADFSGNELYAVDTNDRRDITFLGSIDGFRGPVEFAQDSQGFLYYVDIVGGRVVRVDDIVETGGATIIATPATENLEGSAGNDLFVFAPGSSTTTFLDTIVSWQPGDIIDLTALGLTLSDLEFRLVTGGTTLNIAAGTGPDDFQLRVNLNGSTQAQIIEALVFDPADLPDDADVRPPIASDDGIDVQAGSEIQFNVFDNDIDPNGDAFSLVTFTNPANGTLTDLGNGVFSYTSDKNFIGEDLFSYTIEDETGAQDSATVSLRVTTDDPSVVNQIYAAEGVIEILNGTDGPDNFVFLPGSSTSAGTDSIPNMRPGDTIDLRVLGIEEGDLQTRLVGGGNIVKLIEGFGEDQFQLKVSLTNISLQQVLNAIRYADEPIDPPNAAPTPDDDSASANQNEAISIDVLTNDTDPDGDALAVTDFTQPNNGAVTDLGGGVLQYTPNADFSGTDTFTYMVSDGALSSDATVSVEVIAPNGAPTPADDSASTSQNEAVSINVLVNDTDPDGDAVAVTDFTQPSNGAVTDLGGGVLEYTPNADFSGTDTFSYTVSDGTLSTDATVSVEVLAGNRPPTANNDSGDTTSDAAIAIDVLENDSDPDGDPLQITSFTLASNGTVIDLGNGILQYTPNEGFTGNDAFAYQIEDSDGAPASATVSVTVSPAVTLFGTLSDDLIDGTGERDVIDGLAGSDTINAGAGDDLVYGRDGLDIVNGGSGNDELIGGADNDILNGGENDDRLFGNEGNDTLNGGPGNDFVFGGNGDDQLIGGEGADFLDDFSGNNTFDGGPGFDLLYLEPFIRDGERDTDTNTIIFTPTSGIDVVELIQLPDGTPVASFDPARDLIDVTAFGITAAEALSLVRDDDVYDTVVDFGGENQLFLDGIEVSEVTTANFVGVEPPPPDTDFNIISALVGKENLRGTDAADAFTFTPGTSVNGAIDTVRDWAPGDIIDLSALGLAAEDYEIRTVSGGSVVKLIEGFGDGEFHVKINLNGFSQEEVLASVIYDD
ncbi:MAG: Ig-like domain-containing protein, partial [Pseudomonadota bacterium]